MREAGGRVTRAPRGLRACRSRKWWLARTPGHRPIPPWNSDPQEDEMSRPIPLPVPARERWQLLRAGIQNVWEYDDQRFVFDHGRLLLRGQNESGKTKALEVLLPFLLDANLQPHRLDPFGSSARAMRWNLINESNAGVTVAIGYVWLELGRLEDGRPVYCTVGAGLKARRTANGVEDWYFATSQRVDDELLLLDENRVPLTRVQLEEAIGGAGQVFQSAGEYRRSLNERLFGLPAEQYSALVDALLQLRRPQLSKQLDPSALSRILSASLPPLDAGVIGSLAEGFERLDRHRVEREEYNAALDAVRSFLAVYRNYVASFLKARTLELTRADSAFHAARASRRDLDERRAAAERELQEAAEAIQSLEREAVELDERLKALRASDEYRAIATLEEAEKQARLLREAAAKTDAALARARMRAEDAQRRSETAVQRASADAQALVSDLEAARDAAREAGLEPEHGGGGGALGRGERSTAADTLKTSLRLREEVVRQLRALGKRVAEAVAASEAALGRVRDADDRLRTAVQETEQAEALERSAREAFLEDVRRWAEACRWLPVDPEA